MKSCRAIVNAIGQDGPLLQDPVRKQSLTAHASTNSNSICSIHFNIVDIISIDEEGFQCRRDKWINS